MKRSTVVFLGLLAIVSLLASVPSRQGQERSQALEPGEHQATIRGVRLWYLVRGRGPVLVLQPGGAGWGGDATLYAETLRPLEESNTVIYLDPRGIGRSERLKDPAGYSIKDYAEDLEGLRRHLGLASFALAGHSHGGFVALLYALNYPQHVDRLIILDSGPYDDWSDYDAWCKSRPGYAEAQARLERSPGSPETPEERLRRVYETLLPVVHFHDYRAVAGVMGPILERMIVSPQPYDYWVKNEVGKFDVRPKLAALTMPLLIVAGDEDIPLALRGTTVLRDAARRSELLVVPAAGHWPWIERPELTLGEIRRFLSVRAAETGETPKGQTAEQELLKLEQEWNNADLRLDWATMDRILADDYSLIDSDGAVYTKTQCQAFYKPGEGQVLDLVTNEMDVRVYGDAAVVTMRAAIKETYEGKETSRVVRITNTWIKKAGRWQCVATHSSRVAGKLEMSAPGLTFAGTSRTSRRPG